MSDFQGLRADGTTHPAWEEVANVWAEDTRLPTVDEVVKATACTVHEAAEAIVRYANYHDLQDHETRGAEVVAAVAAAREVQVTEAFKAMPGAPTLVAE